MCRVRDTLADDLSNWDTAPFCDNDNTHDYVSEQLTFGLCEEHAVRFEKLNWLGKIRKR